MTPEERASRVMGTIQKHIDEPVCHSSRQCAHIEGHIMDAITAAAAAEHARVAELEVECEKWREEALQQYPTPDAYKAACAALEKKTARVEELEAERQPCPACGSSLTANGQVCECYQQGYSHSATDIRTALRDMREAVKKQGDAGWTFASPLQDALAAADLVLGEE